MISVKECLTSMAWLLHMCWTSSASRHGMAMGIVSRFMGLIVVTLPCHVVCMPCAWTGLSLTFWCSWGNLQLALLMALRRANTSHASELSMVRSHERYMYAHILQCDLAFRFLVPYSLSFRLFFSADFESSSTVKEKKKLWSPVVHIKLFWCKTRKLLYG